MRYALLLRRVPCILRESYFDLPVSDQADVLQILAPVMDRRAEILEKDIWLCQVLDILFQLPCRKPMAFKGGAHLLGKGHADSRRVPSPEPETQC